jgi:hypothetical protein
MTQTVAPQASIVVRPAQYRDGEAIDQFCSDLRSEAQMGCVIHPARSLRPLQRDRWSKLWRLVKMLASPTQYLFCACEDSADGDIRGLIQVSPFNRGRSTWRVDRVALFSKDPVANLSPLTESASSDAPSETSGPNGPIAHGKLPLLNDIGSLLLRHCFQTIWEARTWLLEVDVNDRDNLALYRQTGFQPLAHMTYWSLSPQQLQDLADHNPILPNLLPVSNADAQLLYQLDTAAMPPLVRQVFDRHATDFKAGLMGRVMRAIQQHYDHTEVVSAYVFETQRKAAIGYFSLRLSRDGAVPHQAELTVHPAYTWLYPELIAEMAQVVQTVDMPQSLVLTSSDYHPEREAYLEKISAQRVAQTLMMSRSVWHKLREAKPMEGLQIAEVLQGLKPARTPVPSRIARRSALSKESPSPRSTIQPLRIEADAARFQLPRDFSDPPPSEGPCC